VCNITKRRINHVAEEAEQDENSETKGELRPLPTSSIELTRGLAARSGSCFRVGKTFRNQEP